MLNYTNIPVCANYHIQPYPTFYHRIAIYTIKIRHKETRHVVLQWKQHLFVHFKLPGGIQGKTEVDKNVEQMIGVLTVDSQLVYPAYSDAHQTLHDMLQILESQNFV